MILCSYWYYPHTVRLPSKMSNGCQFYYACSEKLVCWLVLMKGAFEECITYTQMVDMLCCYGQMYSVEKWSWVYVHFMQVFNSYIVFKINCLASIFNRKKIIRPHFFSYKKLLNVTVNVNHKPFLDHLFHWVCINVYFFLFPKSDMGLMTL